MTNRLRSAFLLAMAAVSVTVAHAVTIDTFSYTQVGYSTPTVPNLSFSLTGEFTGIVDANGLIELADLITLSVNDPSLHVQNAPISFFSFDTNGGGSNLAFIMAIPHGTTCVGVVAAFGFGLCNTGGLAGPVNGWLEGWYTRALPVVTLIASESTLPPPLPPTGPTSVAPEPATFWLLGIAAVMLGLRRPCHNGLNRFRG